MAQYCRYCAHMTCGDANYCSVKDKCYSDSKLKHTNKCKHFEFNPIDAMGLVKEYRPRDGFHPTPEDGEFLWLLVSDDKYELPVIVCDSLDSLAEATGKDKNTIRSAISHAEKRGGNSRYKKVRV